MDVCVFPGLRQSISLWVRKKTFAIPRIDIFPSLADKRCKSFVRFFFFEKWAPNFLSYHSLISAEFPLNFNTVSGQFRLSWAYFSCWMVWKSFFWKMSWYYKWVFDVFALKILCGTHKGRRSSLGISTTSLRTALHYGAKMIQTFHKKYCLLTFLNYFEHLPLKLKN